MSGTRVVRPVIREEVPLFAVLRDYDSGSRLLRMVFLCVNIEPLRNRFTYAHTIYQEENVDKHAVPQWGKHGVSRHLEMAFQRWKYYSTGVVFPRKLQIASFSPEVVVMLARCCCYLQPRNMFKNRVTDLPYGRELVAVLRKVEAMAEEQKEPFSPFLYEKWFMERFRKSKVYQVFHRRTAFEGPVFTVLHPQNGFEKGVVSSLESVWNEKEKEE